VPQGSSLQCSPVVSRARLHAGTLHKPRMSCFVQGCPGTKRPDVRCSSGRLRALGHVHASRAHPAAAPQGLPGAGPLPHRAHGACGELPAGGRAGLDRAAQLQEVPGADVRRAGAPRAQRQRTARAARACWSVLPRCRTGMWQAVLLGAAELSVCATGWGLAHQQAIQPATSEQPFGESARSGCGSCHHMRMQHSNSRG